MITSAFDPDLVPVDENVEDAMIRVRFESGLELATSVSRFPRLKNATPEKRRTWRPIRRGDGIHWPDVDEDISVKALFAGSRTHKQRLTNVFDALVIMAAALGRKVRVEMETA